MDYVDSLGDGVGLDTNENATSQVKSLPEYVKLESERVAKQVKSLQSENTVSFLAISDMHLDSADKEFVNALSHAGGAMALIREDVPIDFAANLGDITTGASTTTVADGTKQLLMAQELTKDAFDGIPSFVLVGNHDPLIYSYKQNKDYLNSKELYEVLGKYSTDVIVEEGEQDRGYCYRDFEDSKLRVISLNTNDIKNVQDESLLEYEGNWCIMSLTQIRWLSQTLKMSDKQDPSEWKILLLSHIPLYTGGYEYVADLLDGFVAGNAGSVSVKGETVEYDFTGISRAKVIANVHGHIHNYRTDVVGKSKIPALCIPNACYDRNNSKATSGSEEYRNRYGEKTTYNKTYGTKEDTSFCVVTIDFEYNRIYATCYGAGYDREISF